MFLPCHTLKSPHPRRVFLGPGYFPGDPFPRGMAWVGHGVHGTALGPSPRGLLASSCLEPLPWGYAGPSPTPSESQSSSAFKTPAQKWGYCRGRRAGQAWAGCAWSSMWPPSWGGGLLSTASAGRPPGEGGKEGPHRGLRSESPPRGPGEREASSDLP